NLVAFFAQRFACLHTGIIKFATLPDHDWTGADEKNFLEFVIPRHLRAEGNSGILPDKSSRLPACYKGGQLRAWLAPQPGSLLCHVRHALAVNPDFADAFDAGKQVINSLAAKAHQFPANH